MNRRGLSEAHRRCSRYGTSTGAALPQKETEQLINSSLARHAPTKKIIICGLEVEVPSAVSCLSHQITTPSMVLTLKTCQWLTVGYSTPSQTARTLPVCQKKISSVCVARASSNPLHHQGADQRIACTKLIENMENIGCLRRNMEAKILGERISIVPIQKDNSSVKKIF